MKTTGSASPSSVDAAIKARPAARRIALLGAVCALFVSPGATQAQQALPLWTSTNEPALKAVYSSGHRFLITGKDSLDVARISLVSEELCGRIERRLKEKVSIPPKDSLTIELRVDPKDPAGRILAKQWVQGPRLVQRMRVVNMDHADSERFTAVFAGLLMCRIAVGKYGSESAPVMPAWLGEGVAQHLDELVRARNHDRTLTMLESGPGPAITEVIDDVDAGETRRRRHLYGMLVGWLYAQPDRAAVFGSLYRQLASGDEPGLEWLADALADGTTAGLERSWQEWLVRQHTIVPAYSLMTPRALGTLQEALHVAPPNDDGALMAGDPISLRDAIGRRREDWVDAAAWQTIVRLERLGLGHPREFLAVIRAYREFLEALAEGRSDRKLRRLLDDADARFADIQKWVVNPDQASNPQ